MIMTTSIYAKKAFDQIQHPFMLKALKKLGIIEGIHLNMIKALYIISIANIILNEGKTETISSKVRNKRQVSTFSTLIQYSA
jgi:hypothetical protein